MSLDGVEEIGCVCARFLDYQGWITCGVYFADCEIQDLYIFTLYPRRFCFLD